VLLLDSAAQLVEFFFIQPAAPRLLFASSTQCT
jgi:hypothetical protein